jgi:hypothetical protein
MNFDATINLSEIIFLFFYCILIFGVPALVVYATYSESRPFKQVDLKELWSYNKKLDIWRVIAGGTWWVHTSSMIMWSLVRTVETKDYLTYMTWGTLLIAKMITGATTGSGGGNGTQQTQGTGPKS